MPLMVGYHSTSFSSPKQYYILNIFQYQFPKEMIALPHTLHVKMAYAVQKETL